MKYEIIRLYDGRKTVTHAHSFEEAYQEYQKDDTCDTAQVYFLMGASETPILLAEKCR